MIDPSALSSVKLKSAPPTRVRTRDGKIFEETITRGKEIVSEYKGQEALPKALEEPTDGFRVSDLAVYEYTGRWKALPSRPAQALGRESLSIISFNVWFSPHKFDERARLLLRLLEERRADIVGLQEVTPRLMHFLCECPFVQRTYVMSECQTANSVTPYGVVLLVANWLSLPRFTIHQLPSRMARRMVMATWQELTVGTVHLESLGNDVVREQQLEILARTAPDVVVGDTNWGAGYEVEEAAVRRLGWRDAWLELGLGEVSTAARGEFGRYDKALFGESTPWTAVGMTLLGAEPQQDLFISDHLGFQLELRGSI